MSNSDAIGLLETQGLVAALHATDEMLKSAAVTLVGKEKIGAAYVTIIVRATWPRCSRRSRAASKPSSAWAAS